MSTTTVLLSVALCADLERQGDGGDADILGIRTIKMGSTTVCQL